MTHCEVAIIRGDGIGIDVTDATLSAIAAAREAVGGFKLEYREILTGAGYFAEHGVDIEPGGEAAAIADRVASVTSTPIPTPRMIAISLWVIPVRFTVCYRLPGGFVLLNAR